MTFFALEVTEAAAPAPYKESSLVSYTSTGASIHLCTSNTKRDGWVRSLQKATRKIAGLGENNILFEGVWTNEQQIVFVQSYCGVSFNSDFKWAKDSDEKTLDNYLQALLFTRDLVNQTPEEMSPESLADQAEKWLTSLDSDNVKARRWTGEELKDAGWMGIYEVGRGSTRPPVLLEIDINPHKSAKPECALVGKGITFDSGGYSIKSSEGMLDMKCDMGGAATLTGALGLAIMQGLDKRVKLFLCCAENLISGHAYKLGDLIHYKNGVSAEIVNTDAEGRLVLADGLMAATESGASLIIDAATLTGAAVMAVGREYNAVFSLHEQAQQDLLSTAKAVNEPFWPLPLELWHQDQCPSPFAHTANSRPQKGGGAGGASNAAGFLARFVGHEKSEWLHLDLAAAYNRNGTELMPPGGTAIGIRTVASMLTD
ncbi:aminopeptidase PepB [Glaciecola petra]|uniref:Aminopeptidase PepB n=1 Tax=Glaciecola petra TaxID=3075602 RepID=A0ABU2ZV42_9ALTE|nr:aminopeptidase PepB [Aestuariibacter sp. P117]MDT0595459.1 aminopeptidase PepB [Aestuariibacter sp. P117]